MLVSSRSHYPFPSMYVTISVSFSNMVYISPFYHSTSVTFMAFFALWNIFSCFLSLLPFSSLNRASHYSLVTHQLKLATFRQARCGSAFRDVMNGDLPQRNTAGWLQELGDNFKHLDFLGCLPTFFDWGHL